MHALCSMVVQRMADSLTDDESSNGNISHPIEVLNGLADRV